MAADATLEVDAIYVATPAHMHCEMVLENMAFGRATLCEKPLGTNFGEVEACFKASKQHGTLLMEGMWTRCFPATVEARRLLHEERILGDIIGVQAEFGYCIKNGCPDGIRGSSSTGGMSRDIGIYMMEKTLLAYPVDLFQATSTHAVAVKGLGDGVDLTVSASIHFRRKADAETTTEENAGGVASLLYTGLCDTTETARFIGTHGSLYFDAMHHAPTSIIVNRRVSRTETVQERHVFAPPMDDGLHKWNYPGSISLQYEALAVARTFRAGQISVDEWTHDDTLAAHAILQDVHASLDLQH